MLQFVVCPTAFFLFPVVVWSCLVVGGAPSLLHCGKRCLTFEGYVLSTMWKKRWYSILQYVKVRFVKTKKTRKTKRKLQIELLPYLTNQGPAGFRLVIYGCLSVFRKYIAICKFQSLEYIGHVSLQIDSTSITHAKLISI